MKTADGVEIDSRTGTVWVIHGGHWPSAVREFRAIQIDDSEIRLHYSTKAAAIKEAERRLAARKDECEQQYSSVLARIATHQEWIDAMRADMLAAQS